MRRSRLKNIANRSGQLSDKLAYKKQRNFVVNLNNKSKRLFFQKLGTSTVPNRKSFWTVCKPIFSTKFTGPEERVSLTENGSSYLRHG